jgi:putative motility protein YjfB-like
MSVADLASSIVALKAGNTQSQIATTLLKADLDAEKNAVETILGISQPSLANVGPGVGGNVNQIA